jgi:hypothetical protein
MKSKHTILIVDDDADDCEIIKDAFLSSSDNQPSPSQRDMKISYELGANCIITKPDTFNKLFDLAKSISRLWL